jgi:hypothetical protein
MKINKKVIKKILFSLLFVNISFLVSKPQYALASDEVKKFSNVDQGSGVVITIPDFLDGIHFNDSVNLTNIPQGTGVDEVYAFSGKTNLVSSEDEGSYYCWSALTPTQKLISTEVATCTDKRNYGCWADPRIAGFCDDIIKTCGNSATPLSLFVDPGDGCSVAIAEKWAAKLKPILQAELDAKIDALGLDKSKATDLIEACHGDEVCIDKILNNALLDDGNRAGSGDNTCDQAAGTLTLAQITSCESTGPLTSVNIDKVNSGTMNSANNQGSTTNKTSGPQVEVTFSSDALKLGEIVTADAVPGFFNNNSDPSNLYFTWFLKREGCENKKDVSGTDEATKALKNKCDFDNNGKITENDWKIAAAQITAKGAFDSSQASYGNNSGAITPGGYKATPSPSKWDGKTADTDDIPNCYIKENTTGSFYELMSVNRVDDEEKDVYVMDKCNTGYHRACVKDVPASNCTTLNPLFSQTDKIFAESQTPPGNYTIPLTSSQTMGSFCFADPSSSNNNPGYSDDPAKSFSQECRVPNEINSSKFQSDINNFQTEVVCNNGGVAMCVKDGDVFFPAGFSTNNPAKAAVFASTPSCSLFFKPNPVYDVNFDPAITIKIPPIVPTVKSIKVIEQKDSAYAGIVGQTCEDAKTKMTDTSSGGTSLAEPTCKFSKKDNLCKHLFPETKTGAVTGDGNLTMAEKSFWKLNPTAESTNGSGKKDEEVLTGLGVNQFKWMYSQGDEVGVAVEGDGAFASDHPDSSYKRMWAFSGGVCKKLNKLPNDIKGFYKEGVAGAERGFLTAEFDLNDCIEGGLIDPAADDLSKLGVQLVASPTNPINDENGRGDVLTITPNEVNVQNLSGLSYEWSVEKTNDAPTNSTVWKDITADITISPTNKNGSFAAADLSGLAKNKLNIDLNIPKAIVKKTATSTLPSFFYLKITVKIASAGGIDGAQSTQASAIVRVRQQRNEIKAYPVSANDAGMLKFPKTDTKSFENMSATEKATFENCVDGNGKPNPTCYVKKNQIVGIEIPITGAGSNISTTTPITWTVNGSNILCDTAISSECGSKKNILFLPILGNVGEAVDVVAAGVDDSKETFEVSRHFVIGDSTLQIAPLRVDFSNPCGETCLANNDACPKYLGKYVDLLSATTTKNLDCSADVWETNAGRVVTVQTTTGGDGLEWSIDGQVMSEYNNQQQIELTIDKTVGESYNIALSTFTTPAMAAETNKLRKALYLHWGVPPAESIEENEYQSASIQMNVIPGVGNSVAQAKSSIFSASLITHLPEQMLFLLKISVASIAIFLMTGLLFAFIPKTAAREE